MSERENILGRIREALRQPAPKPGHPHTGAPHPIPAAITTSADKLREVLPLVPPGPDERLALFRKTATDLKAEFHLVDDLAGAIALLHQLRDREGWTKAGVHRGPMTDPVAAELGLPLCRTDAAYDVRELESCSVGLTECDALVAQTGSVLITSRTAGGRGLSVLPPHHVVLARRDQLLADLPEAFAFLQTRYADNFPSFISFITGPSRTGDIERILVLGAHGPKKMTIVCLP